jgi:hypothetical protein
VLQGSWLPDQPHALQAQQMVACQPSFGAAQGEDDAAAELLQLPRVLHQVVEEDSRAVLSMQASQEQLGGLQCQQQQQQLAPSKIEDAAAVPAVASGQDTAEGTASTATQRQLLQVSCSKQASF